MRDSNDRYPLFPNEFRPGEPPEVYLLSFELMGTVRCDWQVLQ